MFLIPKETWKFESANTNKYMKYETYFKYEEE